MKNIHEYCGLNYKIKDNKNIRDCAKIYFCCCKEDFDNYFETISSDLLGVYSNSSIWYKSLANYDICDEKFEEDLLQMQLFVVVITPLFLYTSNSERLYEMKYAIDHNIPILPLLQDSGLGMDFNHICGDYQYLSKYSEEKDETVLPYKYKLNKFLKEVLLDDATVKKIKDAFDAYIFLSYRKKDRKHAQDIMRLIHNNEFCRDIAIWYDEFLTPGENFRESIASAMNNCSLFALVVTPNILEFRNNKPNFVLGTEYPEAKRLKKNILPIEAVKTNPDDLKSSFAGITTPVSINNGKELELKLNNIFNTALSEKNSTSEHLFFVGLAYLLGIDVEIDHKRAIALIESAAKDGLYEAYIKLVQIYTYGEGVSKNIHQAIEWQNKYVSLLEKNNENRDILLDQINILGMLYYENNSFGDAENCINRCISILENNYKIDASIDNSILVNKSYYYYELGKIAQKQGHFDDACRLYKSSVEFKKKLSEYSNALVNERDLAECLDCIGDIYYEKSVTYSKNIDYVNAAEKYYLDSLSLKMEYLTEYDQTDLRKMLEDNSVLATFDSYHSEIEVIIYKDNAFEHEYRNLLGVDIFDDLISKIEDKSGMSDDCYIDIINSCFRLGRLYLNTNYAKAELVFKYGLSIVNDVKTSTSNSIRNNRYLMALYYNLSNVYIQEAWKLKAYLEYEYEEDEMNSEICKSNIYYQLSFAKKYITKCLIIASKSELETRSLFDLRMLSNIYESMFRVYFAENNYDMAIKMLNKSIRMDETLNKNNIFDFSQDLSIKYINLYKFSEYVIDKKDIDKTVINLNDNHFEKNIYTMRESILKKSEILDKINDKNYAFDLVGDYLSMCGECLYKEKDIDLAFWCMSNVEKVINKYFIESEEPKLYREYYSFWIGVWEEKDDIEMQIKCWLNSIKCGERIPIGRGGEHVVIDYFNLAELYFNSGKKNEAAIYYEKCRDFYRYKDSLRYNGGCNFCVKSGRKLIGIFQNMHDNNKLINNYIMLLTLFGDNGNYEEYFVISKRLMLVYLGQEDFNSILDILSKMESLIDNEYIDGLKYRDGIVQIKNDINNNIVFFENKNDMGILKSEAYCNFLLNIKKEIKYL